MNYLGRKFNTSILLAIMMGFGIGCASHQSFEPTHSWTSENATNSEYRFDNYQCMSQTGVSKDVNSSKTSEFKEYADCMLDRGYALRSY